MKSEYLTEKLKWVCVTNHDDGKTFIWDESFLNPADDCIDNAVHDIPEITSNNELFNKYLMSIFE